MKTAIMARKMVNKITPFLKKGLYRSNRKQWLQKGVILSKINTPFLKKSLYRSNRKQMIKKGVILALKITPF